MSRAFVKEDVEIPERSHRRRSASGLPPGALNYMTARGAERLRQKIVQLRSAGETAEAAETERILESATVVEPPTAAPDVVIFGARVTVRTADGAEETVRIVGVDEVASEPAAVSWVSSKGRALLGAGCGQTLTLDDGLTAVTVVQIEYGSLEPNPSI